MENLCLSKWEDMNRLCSKYKHQKGMGGGKNCSKIETIESQMHLFIVTVVQ